MNRYLHAALLAAVACNIAHAAEGPTWPRPRRQFLGSEWVPISQPCPTCRPVAEPSDVRNNFDEIGLVPPRPPTTRQIHGSGNFFSQSPGLLQNNFSPQRQQFQEFLNFQPPNVVQFPQQNFFTPQQQQSFLPQTYLNNPQLLLHENPQLLPLVNNPQLLLAQQKQQLQQNPNTVPNDSKENQIRFRPEAQKPAVKAAQQNVRLEQQKNEAAPLTRLQLPLNSAPTQFSSFQPTSFQQQQQQPFSQFSQLTPEMQSLLQINPSDPFLTPPPFRPNNSEEIVIPGLDKEEIQLLYVPVETLRQRGHLQGHTVDEPKPTFISQQFQQFQQPPAGHFITQQPNPSPVPQFSPSPAPQFSQSPPPQLSPSPPPRFSPSPLPQFSPTPGPQLSSPLPQSFALPSPSPVLSQNLPSRDAPQQFAPPSPQPPSTTEQVVTIQSRPVSTVRQPENVRLTQRPSSRPTEQPLTTLPHRSSPFTASSKVAENFSNEVTPSFTRSSALPTFATERPFQQLQNRPVQHRFTARPAVETVTEVPIPTTTLQPHQPPLSIYMGSIRGNVQVADVLRVLKDSATIPVLDNFTPNDPLVFVGPANLNPLPGYGKFELPYLSNLDANRIEQRVNLPFFVAPLNFNPPEGFIKIPFPAPHVGSVVVSTEAEERATTPQPHLLEHVNSIEPESTTVQLDTTTVRTRGRRPNQYRSSSKKPVTNSRQRVTPRPQEEETTFPIQENQASTQDFLREPQEERKRGPPRRQRLRSTTESTTEAVTTESSFIRHNFEAQGPPIELNAQQIDFDHPSPVLQQPILPPSDFHQQQAPQFQLQNNFRQPSAPEFESPQFVPDYRPQRIPTFQQQNQGGVFQPSQQEEEGIFEVPPPPPQLPLIENNGDSGFSQPSEHGQAPQIVSTEQPISSTQYSEAPIAQTTNPVETEFETVITPKPLPSSTTLLTTQKVQENEPDTDAEIIDKESDHVDIPKKASRFSHPNVPGVKSYPSTTKVRSHIRSRPRGNPSFTTSTTPATASSDDDVAHFEVSATAEEGTTPSPDPTRTTSKYLSHFNRSRKPLRSSTSRPETTTASATTRTYTVRPLRRSTLRTSVATKRIRKPTTPSPHDEDDIEEAEPVFVKKTHERFSPSAVSNEIIDEQSLPSPKPKVRKPHYQKKKTTESSDDHVTTSPSPSTKTYQERKDEGLVDEPRIEESRTSEFSSPSAIEGTLSPSGVSGPSGPSGDDVDELKKTDERKKHPDSDKKARRRLRVRVQKRPHDNFEAAESQNHGSVANSLIPSSQPKPSAPDLYQFSKGEFDFESSGKFIGTQQKGYVRNITADILENTSTFSAPGADAEVSRVTIATEPTTIMPEMGNVEEITSEKTDVTARAKIQQDSVIKVNETQQTQEVTTQSHDTTKYFSEMPTTEELELTTVTGEDFTTVTVEVPSSTSSPVVQEPRKKKVLRTSTTTQVSRETEICYKGKCIKTNSDNPDQALKQLVESANLEEATKSRT